MARNKATSHAVVAEFRQRLDEARRRLAGTAARTDKELATLETHQAGSATEDVPAALASAVLSCLEGREKHELDEIDAAQARLEAGTYGVCERCAGAIPLGRLRAMPAARHCVSCRRRDEARGG